MLGAAWAGGRCPCCGRGDTGWDLRSFNPTLARVYCRNLLTPGLGPLCALPSLPSCPVCAALGLDCHRSPAPLHCPVLHPGTLELCHIPWAVCALFVPAVCVAHMKASISPSTQLMTTCFGWADPSAAGNESKGKNPPLELLQQVLEKFAFLPSFPLLHGGTQQLCFAN